MNRMLPHTLLAVVLATTALAGCKKKQEEAPVAPPPAAGTAADTQPLATGPAATSPTSAAAVEVVSVELGTATGPDMKVTAPTATFAPKDTIIAAVSTRTADPAATAAGTLGAKWTHLDSSQTVHEESKDVNFSGPGVTDFQISKPDGWPTGRYKVEISLDGNIVQTREFEVR
jgi:outer membrane murein-binding lipoprotein Lpp